MISMHKFKQVKALQDDCTKIEIADKTGLHRTTVAKYIGIESKPKYSPRQSSGKIDNFAPFCDRVTSLLEKNKNNRATDIFEIIKEEGYQGKYRTLAGHVANLKMVQPKERFFEQIYEPGEQSQFDFKESVRLNFVGGEVVVHLHFGTLPHSGFFHITGYPFRNFECYANGIHNFFEAAGGMTKNIRFDNLSPCVKKVLKGNERIYTESFERFIEHYSVGVLPCAPGKGSDKGDVEREIRTQASRIENLVKNLNITFKDFDDLNTWLDEYCQKRIDESARFRHAEEKTHLRALPKADQTVLCKVEIIKPSPFGIIRIGNAIYSVPDVLIGVPCKVVAGPYIVEICPYSKDIRKTIPIVVHKREGEGGKSILLEHCINSLMRKPQAMVRWAHREFLFPIPGFRSFYEYLKKTLSSGAEREFLRSVNLLQNTSISEIGVGMELVIDSKSQNPFEDLKLLLLGHHMPATVKNVVSFAKQPSINTNIFDFDDLIPSILKTGNHS